MSKGSKRRPGKGYSGGWDRIWGRNNGYYNCKLHEKPLNLEEFFELTKDEKISDRDRSVRHGLYLQAWEKQHGHTTST